MEDAERLGLPPEIIAKLAATSKEDGFPIWPANAPIVEAFIAVASQWRATALANGRVHWHGLDYAGVRVGLDAAAIVLTPDQWAGLQVMERAAASALNGYRES